MKQNLPYKGAVVQRDGETYAIKVHMPVRVGATVLCIDKPPLFRSE